MHTEMKAIVDGVTSYKCISGSRSQVAPPTSGCTPGAKRRSAEIKAKGAKAFRSAWAVSAISNVDRQTDVPPALSCHPGSGVHKF
jgi:hypothetical protein